ncbi:inorganic phosphate transporter [Richelia intracellularis]|uniref:inorganic phosphate transporter n=1 Tax=Richelia intracellularis TaxID=1164990 RepID=UPI0039C6B4F3
MANAIATSVGSKAISIKRALIIVGLLEFTGAVLFGRQVSQTLSTQITDPTLFTPHPIFVMGMTSVLLGVGMWLFAATFLGLPVSSSHATVRAIAGFSWAALGVNAVNWSSLESIILAWIITPIISAMTAALFYSQIQYWIIRINQSSPIAQLNEWIPWLSTAIVVIFGTFTLPPVTCNLNYLLREQFNLNIPKYGISILIGLISSFSLTLYSWRQVEYRDIE